MEAIKKSSEKQMDGTDKKEEQKSIVDVFSNSVETRGEHLVITDKNKKTGECFSYYL